uniref:ATP-binding cassette sub-family C member 4-like isoform X2 n=1 Tax=Scatophagus argus TaxID=75038 RepID=UPI001ED84811|nr:ATP-binding cassette sub-family C member 4-like isoform X2 [Scatophagus argus]XP_046238011.1 ATP-binding cassette sub-family C member 4-like isoform X2 [Scatophagus argus]XP_046238012.1 ATP-binding cassette sub-family C member 4-like isoform X2 [Scatophagus argus]XP_046238013.1 ATP-binding cassette sub-family C member 4-like isoform X2 [Scatophagus argus]
MTMAGNEQDGKQNPLATAKFLSKVFLCWLTPLLHLSQKRRLEESDMYSVLPEDRSEVLGEELQRFWDREVRKATKELRKPKLARVLIKCYGKSYAVAGLFVFSLEVIKVIQPLLLWKIIQYFESYDPRDQRSLYMGYGYAAAMSLSAFGLTILQHLYYYHVQRTGMKIRVAVCHMIYRKALSLSSESMGRTTTGQIVNLLSNDVGRFDEITLNLHYLWVGPLQVVAVIVFLWYEIGPSCLAGVAAIALMLPVQTLFGKLFGMFRSKTAVLTDNRIRIMNEVVSGIRIIKMYAWEKPFSALVTEVRRKEISQILNSSYLRGLNMASFFASSKIIVFITFTVYVLLGNTITASSVFVTVSLYGTIKLTVTLFFPLAIEKLSETVVSIHRIKNFLLLGEVERRKSGLPLGEMKENGIEIDKLTCYWDKSVDAPSLVNISISLKTPLLLTVIGPVGAGKSSLLSAILGELPCDTGTLKVKGQLSYAAQQPWVFPGTIRSNILFGKELNPQKYERVIRACALKRDLELLPDGDLTLIGDRGATLSGGQKARVNLARAVYQDADIYLLDDPLSAVDAEVGRHLFEQCICGLLKNKPRILVTHQLQHLRAADQILVLKEGHPMAQGTFSELLRPGLDVVSLLRSDEEQNRWSRSADPDELSLRSHRTNRSHSSHCSYTSLLPPESSCTEELPVETVRAMAEETRVEGNVSSHIYLTYFTAGCNPLVLLVIVLLSVIAEVVYILQDWWLVYWAREDSFNSTASAGSSKCYINATRSSQEFSLTFNLSIYSGLTAVAVVFGYARSLVIFHGLVRSAQTLHNSMFSAVIRTPVRFFDVNPIGRILNRFSKDTSQMDSILPITFVDFYQLFLQNVGVVAVAASVIPLILIPVVPLIFIFLYLRRFYLRTSRDIKRLESTTRSPVFSHLSSSLQGLWTIRALGAERRLKKAFDTHQDLHSEAWFLFLMTSRWFAFRLDGICSIFITLTTFGCILLRDGLDAGEVGLVLTYAVTLIGNFQWTMRQSAEVENMMTSVERVVEYTKLKSEAPWETQKRPPSDWPSTGMVTFDQVSFYYSDDATPVLKDISATFQPNEKVGIVGRTGAGKSSLVSALFRLAEPQGRIYIDGVLTSEIGLHDLRQNMSIIPQDPVLFTDTVRKNLDPFNQHTDEDLWKALEEVQLKSVVEELPVKLETVLAESGSNFSVGQRQLVCLARAILRKNRILLIDEATANVDPRTDELIQKTIRDKFRECTVLTIAHRLNTIIDSDRILVLDNGVIQEFDHPFTLLQNKEGALYKMVQQMGQAEATALLEAATRQAAQQS